MKMQYWLNPVHITAMAAAASGAGGSAGARKRTSPKPPSKAKPAAEKKRKAPRDASGAKGASGKKGAASKKKKKSAKASKAKGSKSRRGSPKEERPGLLRRMWRLRGWFLVAVALGLVGAASCHVHTSAATRLSRSLEAGTFVLVDRLSPEVASVPTGSVVLVRSSQDRARRVLGRVLARGGDSVEWRAGALWVNETQQTLPAALAADPKPGKERVRRRKGRRRLTRRPFPAALGLERVPQQVPRHHVYVLVDADKGAVRGRLVPEGDVVGLARMTLTNLSAQVAWPHRLPRPIR